MNKPPKSAPVAPASAPAPAPIPIIAIDGPAAAGKGTLARRLAAHFDYAYLDTGTLYRGVALLLLQAGERAGEQTNGAAGQAGRQMAGQADMAENAVKAAKKLDMARIDTSKLRSREVSEMAAKIAALPQVRAEILRHQRELIANPPDGKKGVVLDGRDIGTIVCPDAPYKIFVTARPEIRAHRRWLELKDTSPHLREADILADVRARDKQDENRAIAPLKKADNALLLDTSDLAIEEAFKTALALIDQSAP